MYNYVLLNAFEKICKFTLSLKSLTKDLLKKPREISPHMLPQGISGHSKPTHSSQAVGQHKETADILRLAELLRVAVLRGQASCWAPATTRAARALLGSTLLQVFSISPGAGTDHSQQTLHGTQQAGETG